MTQEIDINSNLTAIYIDLAMTTAIDINHDHDNDHDPSTISGLITDAYSPPRLASGGHRSQIAQIDDQILLQLLQGVLSRAVRPGSAGRTA